MFYSVCRYQFGNKYVAGQYVICFATSHAECQIGEHLPSTITKAYYEIVHELFVETAGLNVSAADSGGVAEK